MRAGGFTIQQALSSDSATIIKQSVTLAHRRNHSQVTPLHVATTMLSAATGLLRTACLQSQSHSHPLQCKALDLCFNVALNRLPTSSSNPNHSSRHPSISNALVAAFKRAQAHQRRGTIENQQPPPLFSLKIELEQLIISILDDPSVSRVMREAGFSSTQVKINLQKVVSLELSSQLHPPIASKDCIKQVGTDTQLHNQVKVMNEDVMCVIESLLNKNRSRNLVVVGECVATIEGVVGKVMEKIDKREVHDALKGVKFISLPLSSFGHLSRRDVEQKLVELSSLVKGFLERGVVVYLGDLKWINEFRISSWGHERGHYCPIEHLIIELGRLVCGLNDTISVKLRVMAISSFQTFMKCRNGNPSLEVILKLHPLTIPAGSLSLSLVPQSDIQSEAKSLNSLSLSSWLSDEKVVINNQDHEKFEPYNLHDEGDLRQRFQSNPNSTTNSVSSSDVMEVEYTQNFREFNGKNLKILCNALEEKVPWQKDIVLDIASTILKCRSRMLKRKEKQNNDEPKEETWFLFQGINLRLKKKIAKELAKIVFGSYSSFTTISLSNFSTSPLGDSDSTDNEPRNKRRRDEQSCSYLERLTEAVCVNPHRVFLVEDVELADYCSQMEIKRAIETGKLIQSNGEEVGFCDAIMVLSCESFSSRSSSPLGKQKVQDEEGCPIVSLDLNVLFDEDHEENSMFMDDVGLLESVDKCINFSIQDLSL